MGRKGGGWGVKPEMTNVIFFLFFLMKASLSAVYIPVLFYVV